MLGSRSGAAPLQTETMFGCTLCYQNVSRTGGDHSEAKVVAFEPSRKVVVIAVAAEVLELDALTGGRVEGVASDARRRCKTLSSGRYRLVAHQFYHSHCFFASVSSLLTWCRTANLVRRSEHRRLTSILTRTRAGRSCAGAIASTCAHSVRLSKRALL